MPRYPTVLGFDTARAAHWARRTRDFLISTTTAALLLRDLLTGKVREVWVGDSHTVYLNRSYVTANLLRGRPGVYVVHLGSRLMYSVAAGGLPLWSRRILTAVGRLARRPVPMFICLGEIDVRCHLAKHGAPGSWPLGFVQRFVAGTVGFADRLGFSPVTFVVPPPPCRDHLSVGLLPVVGDFPTRISAFDALRAELERRCRESTTEVRFLDMTPLIFDADNGIRPELTDDQCHVNPAGARLLRGAVDALLADTTS